MTQGVFTTIDPPHSKFTAARGINARGGHRGKNESVSYFGTGNFKMFTSLPR